MGGSASPKPPPPPDMSPMYAMLAQRGQDQAQAIANQAEMLKYAAGMIPSVPTPDISSQNERILNQSIINAQQGRQVENLLDPTAAGMRSRMSKDIENLTSPEAAAARQNQWLKTSGLERVFGTGTGLSTFGASGLADAGTEQGYQQLLRNIQLRQNALGAAPSVGVNPSAAASQIEAAKAQQAAMQNAFQQGILQQGSGLMNNAFQSGSSLADAAMRLKGQDIMNTYQANLAATQMQQQNNPWSNLLKGTLGGASSVSATGNPYAIGGMALLGGGLGAFSS